MKPPHNVAFLERAIRKIADSNENGIRLRTLMSNVIVGQFLDGAVMRGGGALKLRYGGETTRYTMDFDAARYVEEAEFIERFGKRLQKGWNGFSGRLVRRPKARPKNVPEAYIMQHFEVKLTYNGHAWCTVLLEVSYNEVGDADSQDIISLDENIKHIFLALGFPEPNPVPLMCIAHQIAQKLHGVTDVKSVRTQDLIDLQLIMAHETVDLSEVRRICERLFANRKAQAWPPLFDVTEEWKVGYEKMKGDLAVLPSCEDAAMWLNELILMISQTV